MLEAGTSSVARCTYNGARFLAEQLASIAAQGRPPDEIVVCDDGSTDATVEVLQEFARSSAVPVRIYVNESTLGSTRNFEKAIEMCSGEIVFLADQDDVWHPEKVQRMTEAFERSPDVGAVFTDAEIVDGALNPLGYGLWDAIHFSGRERRLVRAGLAARVLLRHNVVTGTTMAFRRRFVGLVNPIPTCWIHDGWVALMISAVAPLDCMNERLVLYRQHPGNQVGTRKEGLAGQIESARKVARSTYREVADQYENALERISKLPASDRTRELVSGIRGKVELQARRWRMPSSPLRRAAWVLRELVLGRYHRYASGARSALKDLAYL